MAGGIFVVEDPGSILDLNSLNVWPWITEVGGHWIWWWRQVSLELIAGAAHVKPGIGWFLECGRSLP